MSFHCVMSREVETEKKEKKKKFIVGRDADQETPFPLETLSD